MNIMLTKPFPQPSLGKVLPAGVIISAPAGLSERLFREGRAKPVPERTGAIAGVATASNDASEAMPHRKPMRKKVKRNG